MTTEKNAFAHLKRIAPGTTFLHRVENSAGAGTPDVFFRSRSREGWIENKVGVLTGHPQRGEDWLRHKMLHVPKSRLKPAQEAWLTSYTARGGVAYVHLYVSPQIFFLVPFSGNAWLDLGNGLSLETWSYQHKKPCEVFGDR